MTKFYLTGAFNAFNDSFHYVKEVVTEQHAVLEFVCDMDGIVANGVDIMTFDDDGENHRIQGDGAPPQGDKPPAHEDEGHVGAVVGMMAISVLVYSNM